MSDPPADDAFEDVAALLAFAVPAAAGALVAGGSMGFYDAPELASCGAGLGVSHPPGHPLFVLFGALASMLPIGPVPMRIALAGGLALGLVGRLAFSLALPLARSVAGPRAPRWMPWLALGHVLGGTLGVAVLRQASRAEVYALAALLAVGSAAAALAPSMSAAARARLAVLVVALGGANHHYIAITAVPAALMAVVDRGRASRVRDLPRVVAAWAAMGAAGLAAYGLLPLRASAAASLVRVRTVGDLVWTVTARAFQKNTGSGVLGDYREHLLDVIDWLGASLSPLGLLAGIAGVVIVARNRVSSGVRLGVVVLAGVLARAWLGSVAGNPDAAGCRAPAVVLLGVLGVAATARAWRAIDEAPAAPEGPSSSNRWLLRLVLVVAPAVVFVPMGAKAIASTLGDRGDAPEVMTAADLAALPARAVVLAYAPDTVFRLRYAQLVEGERPDVLVVPAPFVPWPGTTNALLGRDASLVAVVRDFLSHGAPRMPDLMELAARRPVRLELDPHDILWAVPVVVPRGTFAEVRTEPTSMIAVHAAATAQRQAVDALRAALALSPGADGEPRIAEYVLWRAYHDALFFAARGARSEARTAVATARTLAPDARELVGLAQALEGSGDGPVDITPFVVQGVGHP